MTGGKGGGPTPAQRTGWAGEENPARWLAAGGWEILARNWRCPWGEADIIARKDGIVAFVEVKTRSRGCLASPLEAIGPAKQRRLLKTAWLWLEQTGNGDQPRFDAAALVTDGEGKVLSFQYIESAFDGSGIL